LQWNINRWYDSNVGRWLSEDAIGFESKDTNLLRYVHNTPLMLLNTDGQIAWIPFCLNVLASLTAAAIVSVAAYIISNCSESQCRSSTPPAFCYNNVDFCWRTEGKDNFYTYAEHQTYHAHFGATCQRPCYRRFLTPCYCSDKYGKYEGEGVFKCNKVKGEYLLQFHMKTGVIITECDAAPCGSSTFCRPGNFIYNNPYK
jgi:hypothetical protein